MQYLPREVFVALTDRAWFDFLSGRANRGRLDEVNFWQPRATKPMKQLMPGEPVFFRLKNPDYAIVGYGFFAHFQVLDLDLAWQTFETKNGDPTREAFFQRIGKYRRVDLLRPDVVRDPLGCTILRDAVFWPAERWIPWGDERRWPPNVVQGRTERDPTSVAVLTAAIQMDRAEVPPEFLARPFELVEDDERAWGEGVHAVREGQGTFRIPDLLTYPSAELSGFHSRTA